MSTHLTASERAREVEQNVMELLELYPETRDDDRTLMVMYWHHKDGIEFNSAFPAQFIRRSTSPESISRARRKIQNTLGQFLPSEEKVIERRSRQGELRTHYATIAPPTE